VRGSAWMWVNVQRRGSGWGGPALAGPRALAPRLYAALCGPMSSSPRGGLACARIGLDAGCRGRPGRGAGGARRSRAPGPSRPGCMLRCVDLCPAVHVEASLVRGSAWVRVNDAAAGSGPGWGARRSRAPGPSRPSCMLRCVDLWPAVHVEASLVRGSAWMRVNAAAARSGPGRGARRSRAPVALAPRLYAALCGPMASSPRGGLACGADRLGCV